MGNFHEVLPGISVFSNFYYICTKEFEYLNHTIEFSIEKYTIDEIFINGGQFLAKKVRDQAVGHTHF